MATGGPEPRTVPKPATDLPLKEAKPRPKRRHRKLSIALVVALIVILVASSAGYYFVERTLPTIDGTVRVAGLSAPVQVLRDRYGVPHIFAQSPHDAFFAQGYVTAQDRLWQMEFFRRLGRGTLSEIFGSVALDSDRFMRTVGLYRVSQQEARQLDGETKAALEAYAAGVNAFVETHRDRLPLEFTILGFQPEPWVPADSLVWGKILAWELGGNWERELLRARLLSRFGADALRELVVPYPADAPIIVPPEINFQNFGAAAPPDLALLGGSLHQAGADVGSNNWVVDGAKSATGQPLLANDPHLEIQMPSIWYETELNAPSLNVSGATLAGVPGIVIGHNERIAWGVTNAGPDVQDLYVEKINPDNPHQYLYQDHWEDMHVIPEEIKVKGKQEPVRFDVLITRHGPLINGVVKGVGQPLALRWTALQPGESLRSILMLDRAQNWAQFREALRYFAVPSQNFVYADTAGNIGYQMPGWVPVRAKGDGLLPVPGWTGEYEWTGFIPFDRLPSVYNPKQHFLVTANNRVVDDTYPYFLSYDWDPGFRAKRISDLLQAKEKLGVADFQQIQSDVVSLPDRQIARFLAQLQPKDEDSRRALAYVRAWDGSLTAESVAGAIVEVTYVQMLRNFYADAMGEELFKQYLESGAALPSLLGLLHNDRSAWFSNARSPAQPSREEAVQESFSQAVQYLKQRFGDNPADWRWGRLHTATFAHPLGSLPLLDRIFDLGPYERSGDRYTVNDTGYSPSKPYAEQTVPSLREILDLGNWDRSLFVHTTGQSGQPFSPHMGDFAPLWLRGDYHPMLFSKDKIEQQREGRLILTP